MDIQKNKDESVLQPWVHNVCARLGVEGRRASSQALLGQKSIWLKYQGICTPIVWMAIQATTWREGLSFFLLAHNETEDKQCINKTGASTVQNDNNLSNSSPCARKLSSHTACRFISLIRLDTKNKMTKARRQKPVSPQWNFWGANAALCGKIQTMA